MTRKARNKKDRDTRRELLFCNTQPVVGGWLTSTVILELHFTRDSEAPDVGSEMGVGRLDGVQVRAGEARTGQGEVDTSQSCFPGETVREPQELEEFLQAEEADAYPQEAAFAPEEGR